MQTKFKIRSLEGNDAKGGLTLDDAIELQNDKESVFYLGTIK